MTPILYTDQTEEYAMNECIHHNLRRSFAIKLNLLDISRWSTAAKLCRPPDPQENVTRSKGTSQVAEHPLGKKIP